MSLQQVAQPRSSGNAFGRRRADREMGGRVENKVHSGKSPSNFNTMNGGKLGGFDGPARDRFVFFLSSFRGHRVEVQVKDGSIFSGIFHAANIGKDIGIVLKMARQTKDGSLRGQKAAAAFVSKPPSKTYIIYPKDLVQVIAKDVLLTGDAVMDGQAREKRQDIMIDSHISQSRHLEVERELERWTPDGDDPQCPELENIFDNTWNRNWDQFETNETLFGVKSTFNEELYTTKLERGPQMREREREAMRIAREIEGEETEDLHLAEERGIHRDDFDVDEESRFSSVFRGVDDGRYEENDDNILDEHNDETFGTASKSGYHQSSDISRVKSNDGVPASSSSSSADGSSFQYPSGGDTSFSVSNDHVRQFSTDGDASTARDDGNRLNESQTKEHNNGKNYIKDFTGRKTVSEDSQTSKSEEVQLPPNSKKTSSDKGRLSPAATAYAPSSTKGQEKTDSSRDIPEVAAPGKDSDQLANSRIRPGSSTSSTSDCVGAASVSSGPGLSPSSSVGSLSSEKSTLNPHAKEFKLNPNAKSFTPSLSSIRPPSPLSEGPLYYPAGVSAVPHMQGVPVGVGIGPSYGGQPVMYNPSMAPMQSPQAYVHPTGPMYGQPMILGQPRPVGPIVYMPTYPHEMQYKGRDF